MTKLYKFQRRVVRRIERFKGRALLADEMGLGKTAQGLFWAKNFLIPRHKKRCPIIVVCPASIKINWQREAMKHVKMVAEILSSRKVPDRLRLESRHPILIINYDILQYWVDLLISLKPKLVIGDEVHYIKSRDAKRTKAFRRLCQGVPHVIGMSGTPLTNRPAELWPTLNVIRPDVFPTFYPFGSRYCRPEITPWGVKYNGAKRLDELHDLLKSTLMIRRKKSQVLKDLPLKQRIVVPVDIEDRKQYVEAEKEFIRWMIRTHPQKADKARRAERLVKMGYLKRLVALLKMKALKEWIDNFLEETGSKLITFGVHRSILIPLTELFPDKAVRVDGKITGKKRQEAFDGFNHNKKIRLLFGNIQAAGVGWSCNSAYTTLFAELAWTPGEHQQAEDRIHGVGRGVKGRRSTSYYLIAKGTIEERLAEIIQQKQEILDSTLDGGKQVDALNIMDALEEAMIRKRGGVV